MNAVAESTAMGEEFALEGYTLSYVEWLGPIADTHHDRARAGYASSGTPPVDTVARLADEAGIHVPTIIVRDGWFTIIHPVPDNPWDLSIADIFAQAMEKHEVFLH